MVGKIAVLALQGDYQQHALIIAKLGLQPMLLRYPEELDQVDGLVIPGGESTVLSRLITLAGLYEPLINFSKRSPILGTCAGLIIMGRLYKPANVNTLNIMDVEVERNAYGRQSDSFVTDLSIELEDRTQQVSGCFIRAPIIKNTGSMVKILAEHGGAPVAVCQGKHLGLTFHPEIDELALFHEMAFM